MVEWERRLRAYGRAADDRLAPVTIADVESAAGPGSPRPTARSSEEVPDVVVAVPSPREAPRGRRPTWRLVAAVVVLLAATGALYVALADGGEDNLDTLDQTDDDAEGVAPPATASTTTTTTVPADPWAFAITYIEGVDAGNAVAVGDEFAWVAGTAEPILSTIDLATNQVVASTEIPPDAGHANFGFGSVWINHDDGTVTRFDPDTDTVVARIEVGGQPTWIEPGVDSMWLGNGPGREAVRIDPATNEVSARIDVGGERAGAIGQNPSGVWIKTGTDHVARIDPATNEVVATVRVPTTNQGGMMVSPEAVWMSSGFTGEVIRVDPDTNRVADTIDVGAAVGEQVQTRSMQHAGGTLWTPYQFDFDCDQGDCTPRRHGIARIDPATNEVVATAELRGAWTGGGLSVGRTTVWIGGDPVITRFDF